MRLLWFGWAARWAAGRDRRGSSWVPGLIMDFNLAKKIIISYV
jgi:hypothetical protein